MKTFSTEESDAWLDAYAFGGLHVPELILDMTVRHPVVARYQQGSSQRAGVVAAAGDTDKRARYPLAAGAEVLAFAVETLGLLGE